MSDGTRLTDLLLVRKERLNSAFVAAVQEVAARSEALGRRLQDAEAENARLSAALDSM